MNSRLLTFPHRFALRDGDAMPTLHHARQVHGRETIVVDAKSEPGAVRARPGDALVCADPGVFVAVRTADCVPILVESPTARACAAIHAGWRGLVAGVIEEALTHLPGRPVDFRAALGPSIGPCCFEVGEEVAARFPGFVVRRHRAFVDLRAAARKALQRLGVWQIDDEPSACTRCDPRGFYSYRRDGAGTKLHTHYIGVP